MNPSSNASSQPHILVIDHAPDLLTLYEEMLGDEGYRVTTSPIVSESLRAIEDQVPDLIILDYLWASADDEWSVLQAIRSHPATVDVPVLLCTGAIAHVAGTKDQLAHLNVDVIQKPFQIDDLFCTLRRILDHSSLSDQVIAS